MPDCRDCGLFSLIDGQPHCKYDPAPGSDPTSLRYRKTLVKRCELAIFDKYLPEISGEVLEVGAGVFRRVRKLLHHKARWTGIDPAWVTNVRNRSYQASVNDIPFSDGVFDWVVAMSTMEHWGEYKTPIRNGLREIYRVLKPGGKLLVTVPMYNHGAHIFYYGMLDAVKKLFRVCPWEVVTFETWAKDPTPFKPLQEWRIERYRTKALLERTGGVAPSTYTVEILVRK